MESLHGESFTLLQHKMDLVLARIVSNTDQEIIRLNIPMNKIPVVQELQPVQHLIPKHQHRF